MSNKRIDMSDNRDKVYSENGEDYGCGDYQSAVEQCIDENTKVGDTITIFKAEAIQYSHADFVRAESIIEDMQNCAWDTAGEFAETYLEELKKEDFKELDKLIIDWLSTKSDNPRFYTTKNDQPIQVEVTEDML